MKILAITDYYRDQPENGSEVFCCELINALRGAHEIDVLARTSPSFGHTRNRPRWSIDDRVANDSAAFAQFLSHIDTTRYDLVYNAGALMFGCEVVELLRIFNPALPLVNHYQALLGPYADAEGKSAGEASAHAAGQMLAAAGAHANIFISQAEQEAAIRSGMQLEDGIATIIPNGLSFAEFDQVRADRSFLPRGRENSLVIATAGRFSDLVKGADLVYRAFIQLAAENRDVFLVSITNSDRFAFILDDVPPDRWCRLSWLPRQQFLQTLSGSDLVVLPSRHEPFGLIAIEALSLGVPVLANAVGGLAEIVRHGEFGILNPLDDGSFGLYTALAHLVQDRTQLSKMGRDGQRFVRNKYSIERIVTLTDAVLHEALLIWRAQWLSVV